MTQLERQNLPFIHPVSSGHSSCGSHGLTGGRKQVVFDLNVNMKQACYGRKVTATCLDKT